jgi:hypothetical protein
MATTPEVTLLVCANGNDSELRDIWRIVRRPGEFRSLIGDKKELERVYQDGRKPYLKGRHGLAKWIHPRLYASLKATDPKGRDKHLRQGWPTWWSSVQHMQPTVDSPVVQESELSSFPLSRVRSREHIIPFQEKRLIQHPKDVSVCRVTVNLALQDYVSGSHYLALADGATRSQLRELSQTGLVWYCSNWTVWSIVLVQVGHSRG